MIRIKCPYCGLRDHSEFNYIGDATKIRPVSPELANDEEWFDYIYIRDIPEEFIKNIGNILLAAEAT